MKRLLLHLSFFVFVLFGSARAYAYNNTYAVIVAVADYKYSTAINGDLKYTISDAEKFYSFLKSSAGGTTPSSNIAYLTNSNATRSNIITKAKNLFAKAKADDRVIFYFSGHGDRNCILPYDVDMFGTNLLWFSEIQAIFRCANCNTKLLIAYACHSGSMKEMIKRQTGGRHSSSSTTKPQIAVMMSCSANEYSIEAPELGQGVFSYYLINGLKGKADNDKNGKITLQELFYYVYNKTSQYGPKRQHPILFGNFDLRLIVGRVYK